MKIRFIPALLPSMIFLIGVCLFLGAQDRNSVPYKESYPEFQPKTDLRPDKVVLLYPEGQAAGKGIVEDGVEITFGPTEDNGLRGEEICNKSGNRRNVGDDARMDLYFPEKPNGLMVIIAPGGGYSFISTFNEGTYVAKWMVDHGITACVLKYRMPNGHKYVPLEDAQNALRYCRHHAAEWGVNKIGIEGSSAGGHLASFTSVMYKDDITRPDFAILLYPRITLRRNEECNTKENLVGKDEAWDNNIEAHLKLLEECSPNTYVNENTPPTFFVLSSNDKSVPATNFIPYYTRLIENNVPVELHVYPTGGHGWGFSSEEYKGKGKDKFSHYRPEFEKALERWLEDLNNE